MISSILFIVRNDNFSMTSLLRVNFFGEVYVRFFFDGYSESAFSKARFVATSFLIWLFLIHSDVKFALYALSTRHKVLHVRSLRTHEWLPLSLRSSGQTSRHALEVAVHAVLSATFWERKKRTLSPGKLKNCISGLGSKVGYQACDLAAVAALGLQFSHRP